ncbi:MAG TPA: VCBS domain-containing protein, partial [Stellaceae bacterium]|nr:VCBS domain-containing protein [Stellaceae bacterium]
RTTGAFSFTLNPTGAVETIAHNTTVTDTITFTATDGHGDSAVSTVNIVVSAPAETVTATMGSTTVADDMVANGTLAATGDSDDPVTISAINEGTSHSTVGGGNVTLTDSFGTLVVNQVTGAYSFTLNETPTGAVETLAAGATVIETLTYTASDGHGDTGLATLQVTITVPTEVVNATISSTTVVDETKDVGTGTLSERDDALTALGVSSSSGTTTTANGLTTITDQFGTLVVKLATGAYTFTLNESTTGAVETLAHGATALDSFTFTVQDGHGDTGTATLSITVSAAAETVNATITSATVVDETQVSATGTMSAGDDPVSLIAVGNSAAPAGGTLTVSDSFGTLVVNQANGAYTFTLNATGSVETVAHGTSVIDSFTFTVADGHGDTGTATLHISVSAPAEALTATVTPSTLVDDSAVTVVNGALSANGALLTAPANTEDQIMVTTVAGGTNATAPVIGGGTVTVTDTFGTLLVNETTGSYTFTLNPNGGIETVTAGTTVIDSFNLSIHDGHGDTGTGVLKITLSAPAEVVTATAAAGTVVDDKTGSNTGTLHAAAQDGEDAVHLATVSGGTSALAPVIAGGIITFTDAFGTLLVNQTSGAYTFTLNDSANGAVETVTAGTSVNDSFIFTAIDGHGDTATSTLTIHVSAPAEPLAAVVSGSAVTDDTSVFSSGSATINGGAPNAEDHVSVFSVFGGTGFSTTVTNAGNIVITDQEGALTINQTTGAYVFALKDSAADALTAGTTFTETFTEVFKDGHGDQSTGGQFTIIISAPKEAITATETATPHASDDGAGETSAVTGTVTVNQIDDFSATNTVHVTSITGQAANGAGGSSVSGSQLVITDGFGTFKIDQAPGGGGLLNTAFTLNPAGLVENIAAGGSVLDTFTVNFADTNGDTGSTTVNVLISAAAEPLNSTMNEINVAVDVPGPQGNPFNVLTDIRNANPGHDDPLHVNLATLTLRAWIRREMQIRSRKPRRQPR